MRTAVIGMGNMGSKYAEMIAGGKVIGMEMTVVTRVSAERWEKLPMVQKAAPARYDSADDVFDALDRGELALDAVIIVTPHYSHEEIAIKAFERGLHVLCDKPAGVYTRQARNMLAACRDGLCYGYVFHQRTYPVYEKMREIVQSGKYGAVQRVNWIVTDWYRPEAYYTAAKWRGTWGADGGGTLLNQCPHNLDLLQWICSMPERVQGFCHEGKYHSIEVEDEVTAYLEWGNGATGVFIASTGEAAGVNRLEITLTDALLVCDHGQLSLNVLDRPEKWYHDRTDDLFGKPVSTREEIACAPAEEPYEKVLNNFAAAVRGEEALIAPGKEAFNSLCLSNAIYLSSWQHRMLELPAPGTAAETEFERAFEAELERKIKSL